jgi:hypothetical protein
MDKLGVIKELPIEPCDLNYSAVLDYIDNTKISRVKTKYSKGDAWTALSLRGYGEDPSDILKPNVLGSKVKIEVKLRDTHLLGDPSFRAVRDIMTQIPSTFERVRLMKIKAKSAIGKHSDRIDKDFGFNDGNIVRIHVPIRTNEDVVFYLWEGREKTFNHLKTGHFYYVDVRAPHSVINNSNEDRIHLVMDTYVNHEVKELLGLASFW